MLGNCSSLLAVRRDITCCSVQETASSSGSSDSLISEDEIEARLRKAVNFIKTSDKLVPYDPASTNLGLVIWQAIRAIPEQHRHRLVKELSSGDIRRLWTVAGLRYSAPPGAIAAAIGPEYSLWRDLPQDIATIVYFEGKAALPNHALGISSFTKAFFLGSERGQRANEFEEHLFGRVIHPTPIANRVWPGPMYFRSSVGTSLVPVLGELCDLTIAYLDPDELKLNLEDIPRSAWPLPRQQLRPFDGGYIDYVRTAGPSVLVGLGYRTREAGSGLPMVPSPLYFIMVKSKVEHLN